MQNGQAATDWIAVDWGTSNLRVWFMGKDNVPVAEASSDQGMGSLSPAEFEPTLLALIAPYLSQDKVMPVICAGMVGAKQGWAEAAYIATPCNPTETDAVTRVETVDPRISVRILPGVKQLSPPNVMRGEETQIAGALAANPNFDGVVCLPGTHSKWVHVSAGEIVSFQTFMTGELFALLSQKSVLRHSFDAPDWDDDTFLNAVADSMSRPQGVAAQLFSIRASGLVSAETTSPSSHALLSGLLIGLELAGSRPYWLGQNVALLGSEAVSKHYQTALSAQGVDAQIWNITGTTLAGLALAHNTKVED